jgi:hypothetical protein
MTLQYVITYSFRLGKNLHVTRGNVLVLVTVDSAFA